MASLVYFSIVVAPWEKREETEEGIDSKEEKTQSKARREQEMKGERGEWAVGPKTGPKNPRPKI
jgi:hypothetical protein